MRIDCSKGREALNKILNGIDTFKMENYGDSPSYIIMNYKTGEDILDPYHFIGVSSERNRLFGISVAYNEGLKYGEVDII